MLSFRSKILLSISLTSAFIVGTMAAHAAVQQQASGTPAADAAPPPPLKAGDGVQDTFFQSRRSFQETEARGLVAVGREKNLTGLRSVVRASMRARDWSFRPSGATEADLQSQDIEAVAQFLATLGYGPEDVAPGKAGGAELIQSAGRIVLGGASLSDKARVSPIVVLAQLSGVTDNQNLGDAYRSTAAFQTIETLKGIPAPGTTVSVRQRSGLIGNNQELRLPTELQPRDTGRYLMFLSPAAYEARSRKKQAATSHYAQVLVTYRLDGENLIPLGEVEHGPATIGDIRASIR